MARFSTTVPVLLLTLLLLVAAPGLAQAAGDEAGGGVNILEPRFDLTIWTIVVFALLFLILRVFAWKPMLEGLQNRERNIQGALDEAQRVRNEAETIRAQLHAEMSKAHEKVRELLDEARRDGEHTKAEKVAEAEKQIQTEKERSLREIHTARDQALQELWNQSAQLATLISAKAIRRNLSENDHRGLVDEAVNELRGAAATRRG